MVDVLRLKLADLVIAYIKKYGAIEIVQTEQRYCSCCSLPMDKGYCINGGEKYFCSEKCLKKVYSNAEIEDLQIGSDDSDSYYTDWTSVINDEEIEDVDNNFIVLDKKDVNHITHHLLSVYYQGKRLVFSTYEVDSSVKARFSLYDIDIQTLADICDKFINNL